MTKRFGLWALLAAVIAALLAACGGDDEPETRPTSQPTALPTPQSTAAAALDYDALSQLDVGEPAPEFTLPATDGGSVSLSDYRGQPVLLFFHMAVG